jgi:hypothetical protein
MTAHGSRSVHVFRHAAKAAAMRQATAQLFLAPVVPAARRRAWEDDASALYARPVRMAPLALDMMDVDVGRDLPGALHVPVEVVGLPSSLPLLAGWDLASHSVTQHCLQRCLRDGVWSAASLPLIVANSSWMVSCAAVLNASLAYEAPSQQPPTLVPAAEAPAANRQASIPPWPSVEPLVTAFVVGLHPWPLPNATSPAATATTVDDDGTLLQSWDAPEGAVIPLSTARASTTGETGCLTRTDNPSHPLPHPPPAIVQLHSLLTPATVNMPS